MARMMCGCKHSGPDAPGTLFSGVTAADKHQRMLREHPFIECLDPASVGLVPKVLEQDYRLGYSDRYIFPAGSIMWTTGVSFPKDAKFSKKKGDE